MDSLWDDNGNDTSVSNINMPTNNETRRVASSNEMKKAYDEMEKAQRNIQNE